MALIDHLGKALYAYAAQGAEQKRQTSDLLMSIENTRKAYTGEYEGLLDPALMQKKGDYIPIKCTEWDGALLFLEGTKNPLRSDFCAAWVVPPAPASAKTEAPKAVADADGAEDGASPDKKKKKQQLQ